MNDNQVIITDYLNQDMANVLHQLSKYKQTDKKNDNNYIKEKFLQITSNGNCSITVPRSSIIRNQYSELFDNFVFIRSAYNPLQYLLFIEFKGKILAKNAKKFCDDLVKCIFSDKTLKAEHQQRNTQFKRTTIYDIINTYTGNNVQNQYVVHLTHKPQQGKQIAEPELVEFTNVLYKRALEIYSMMYKYGESETLRYLNELPYIERLQQLRYQDFNQLKRGLLNESYLIALQQVTSQVDKDGNQKYLKYFEQASESVPICQFINENLEKHPEAFYNAIFRPDLGNNPESINSVHPHPLVYVSKNIQQLLQEQVLELGYYDIHFWYTIMLVSRWFGKVILTEDKYLSSNHSALYMYGKPGAGKSELLSTLSQYMYSYKWQQKQKGDNFQSPQLLCASSITLEEFPPEFLCENSYKQILDINSSFKTDIKLQHPVNATLNTPCIMTSNPSPVQKFHQILSQITLGKTNSDRDSLGAGYRRVYLVPFFKIFKDLYPQPNCKGQDDYDYSLFYETFKDRRHLRPQLFNFIFAFACLQQGNYNLQWQFSNYCSNVLEKFSNTIFGQFYLANKQQIDKELSQIEKQLSDLQVNSDDTIDALWNNITRDTESEFSQFIIQVITSSSVNKELMSVLKDRQTHRYLRFMRICSNPFILEQYEKEDYKQYLNQNVQDIINIKNCSFLMENPLEEDDLDSITSEKELLLDQLVFGIEYQKPLSQELKELEDLLQCDEDSQFNLVTGKAKKIKHKSAQAIQKKSKQSANIEEVKTNLGKRFRDAEVPGFEIDESRVTILDRDLLAIDQELAKMNEIDNIENIRKINEQFKRPRNQ